MRQRETHTQSGWVREVDEEHTHGSALLNLEAKMHFPAARTEEVTTRQPHELVTWVILSTHSAGGSAADQRFLSKRRIETVMSPAP